MHEMVENMTRMVLGPHMTLMNQGESGNDMFILESGSMKVVHCSFPQPVISRQSGSRHTRVFCGAYIHVHVCHRNIRLSASITHAAAPQ